MPTPKLDIPRTGTTSTRTVELPDEVWAAIDERVKQFAKAGEPTTADYLIFLSTKDMIPPPRPTPRTGLRNPNLPKKK